jgi:hypothetical protein
LEWQGVTHRVSLASEFVKTNFEDLNLAVVTDEFNADMFAKNVDTKQHIEKGDETARSESDAPVDTGGEVNEANLPSSAITLCDVPTSNRIDWFILYRQRVESIKVEAYKPSRLSKPQGRKLH